MIPTDVDAIVFDLDGTLLDTEPLYREAFEATCAEFTLPFIEAAHRRLVGLSRRERAPLLQAQLGDDVPLEVFLSAYRGRKKALLRDGVPVRAGALALLRALRLRRFPCAIATSATRNSAFELLRRGLLLAYVDRVVTRDDVEHGKPHPQTYEMAAGFLRTPARALPCHRRFRTRHGRRARGGHDPRAARRARTERVRSVRRPCGDAPGGPAAAGDTLMRIVIFGLAVSSSWGNGHAALWRGLIAALLRDGHRVTFFERDQPFYAEHRDLTEFPEGGRLLLYPSWADIRQPAERCVAEADVAMVTSYCPDALDATELLTRQAHGVRCFYDLDTPVTLARVAAGETVPYLGTAALRPFDLVLSYTGGGALAELQSRLGARRVVPLYGSVDPLVHRPVPATEPFRAALSYLGTYAQDRQATLNALLVEPARRRPDDRFLIGGAMYPADFPWTQNIWFARHVPPDRHPDFYCSSRMTLNVTRAAMARLGHCPSGRLFEAAACGTPILTDAWDGLQNFFTPGQEILVTRDTDDALAALSRSDADLAAIAARARERTLDEHTAARRARQMIAAFETAEALA